MIKPRELEDPAIVTYTLEMKGDDLHLTVENMYLGIFPNEYQARSEIAWWVKWYGAKVSKERQDDEKG